MEDPYRWTILGRSIKLAYVPVLYTLPGIYFEARNLKGNFFKIHQQSGLNETLSHLRRAYFAGMWGKIPTQTQPDEYFGIALGK